MGRLIAIDKLYMNKIPNSCKECPLTYLDTGDDAYFGANERRCVIDDSCIDGMVSERAYDCPLVEAIPKDEYESRLKADMVAILAEIQLEIEEEKQDTKYLHYDDLEHAESYNIGINNCSDIIQQKINSLNQKVKDEYGSVKSEVHCACTDEEISKSFIEDVSAVEEQLPKQANDKIVHVGDEIYSELTDSKAVVQRIDAWHRYQCFTDEGAQFVIDRQTFNDYWVKTGKNYPQIAEVLKQIKGDK